MRIITAKQKDALQLMLSDATEDQLLAVARAYVPSMKDRTGKQHWSAMEKRAVASLILSYSVEVRR